MALKGVKVIEMAGLAPGPLCGMILADHGASVIRVDRMSNDVQSVDTLARSKQSIAINLKQPSGLDIVKKLCRTADVLIEPFRKGVMEKLGLGPNVLCNSNRRLVYARLSGFGQVGPYSHMAGHDINYIAVSGVLSRLGRADYNPHAPINLLADFAGGGMTCALGIILALYDRTISGEGQVIDANMVHGSAYIGSFLWSTMNRNHGVDIWGDKRGKNLLDGGAPFYDTYQTKDAKYMAVGALEPKFYAKFIKGLGLDPKEFSQYKDWELLRRTFKDTFLTKTQAEWAAIFDGSDACVTPVLEIEEASQHPHNKHIFLANGEYAEPCPAPNLSRTPGKVRSLVNPHVGEHTVEILRELGMEQQQIDSLLDDKVVEQYTNSKL